MMENKYTREKRQRYVGSLRISKDPLKKPLGLTIPRDQTQTGENLSKRSEPLKFLRILWPKEML